MKYSYFFLLFCFIGLKNTTSQNATISFSLTSPLCFNDCNGSIYSSISGGLAPYNYNWSNGLNSSSLTSVCAGDYTLTVTDANSVVTTSIASLSQPTSLFLFEGYCGLPCYASYNGTLCVNILGGTPPFVYTYNGQTYPDYLCSANVGSGIQSYTVTDGNGCQLSDTTLFTSHPQTTGVLSYTNPSCSSCCDGIIEVLPTVFNNTLQFDLYLQNGNTIINGNNPTFNYLCPGNYSVVIGSIIGSSYCANTYTTSIDALATGLEKLDKEIILEIYPNPTSSILNISAEKTSFQGSTIEIKNILGKVVFVSQYTPQIDLSGLCEGMYFLTIQDKSNIKSGKIIKQ